jgi:hypothetical protein
MTPLPTTCPACNAPAKLNTPVLLTYECRSKLWPNDGEFEQSKACQGAELEAGDGLPTRP